MARYKQPSKINGVSIVLLLALLAAVYAGIKFGPPYFRKYQVKEILDEVASKCRAKNRQVSAEQLDQFERDAEKKILATGVEDGAVRVRVTVTDRDVSVQATYREVIRHWLVSRTTTLNFAPLIERERIEGF